MKITLIRKGGIIPITKKAEQEVSWSEEEIQSLIDEIKKNDEPGIARDSTNYLLNCNNETFAIDWDKIPGEYIKTFENLKDNLAIH
jgi:hypothetical protein